MDINRKYVEEDTLGIPAESALEARNKAIEHLEFLKKTCIKILDANKIQGRNIYDVDVEYVEENDYPNIKGKVKDILYVPSSSERDAKNKARETLEFRNKQYINILNATKRENKQNYAVEVEYVEKKPKMKF